MSQSVAANPSPFERRRPFPWVLLRHWVARYLPVWLLLALVIAIVQLVLAAVRDRHNRRSAGRYPRRS